MRTNKTLIKIETVAIELLIAVEIHITKATKEKMIKSSTPLPTQQMIFRIFITPSTSFFTFLFLRTQHIFRRGRNKVIKAAPTPYMVNHNRLRPSKSLGSSTKRGCFFLRSFGMVSKAKDTIIIMTHKIIPVHDKKDVNLDTLNFEPKTDVESLVCNNLLSLL